MGAADKAAISDYLRAYLKDKEATIQVLTGIFRLLENVHYTSYYLSYYQLTSDTKRETKILL